MAINLKNKVENAVLDRQLNSLKIDELTTVRELNIEIDALNKAREKASDSYKKKFDEMITKYTLSKNKLITICRNDIARNNLYNENNVQNLTRDNFANLSLHAWNKILSGKGINIHEMQEFKTGDATSLWFLDKNSPINYLSATKAAAVGLVGTLSVTSGLVPMLCEKIGSLALIEGATVDGAAVATALGVSLSVAASALAIAGAAAALIYVFKPEIQKFIKRTKDNDKIRRSAQVESGNLHAESGAHTQEFAIKAKALANTIAFEDDPFGKVEELINAHGKNVSKDYIDAILTTNNLDESNLKTHATNVLTRKADEIALMPVEKIKDKKAEATALRKEYLKWLKTNEIDTVFNTAGIDNIKLESEARDSFTQEVQNIALTKDSPTNQDIESLKNKYKGLVKESDMKQIIENVGLGKTNIAVSLNKANSDSANFGTDIAKNFKAFKDSYDGIIKHLTTTGSNPNTALTLIKDLEKTATEQNFNPSNSNDPKTVDRAKLLVAIAKGMIEILKEVYREKTKDITQNPDAEKIAKDYGVEITNGTETNLNELYQNMK